MKAKASSLDSAEHPVDLLMGCLTIYRFSKMRSKRHVFILATGIFWGIQGVYASSHPASKVLSPRPSESSGRIRSEEAKKINLNYTIGGEMFPFENIVDKSVRIDLIDGALENAIAIDAKNKNHEMQELIEKFLRFAPQDRDAVITAFYPDRRPPAYRHSPRNARDSAARVTLAMGGFIREPEFGMVAKAETSVTINNDILNMLFRVVSIGPLEDSLSLPSHRAIKPSAFIYSAAEMKNQLLLNGLIGHRVFIEDSLGVHIGDLTASTVNEGRIEIELLVNPAGEEPATETLVYKDESGLKLLGIRDVQRTKDHSLSTRVVGKAPLYFDIGSAKAMQIANRLDLTQPISGWAYYRNGRSAQLEVFEGIGTLDPSSGQLNVTYGGHTYAVDPQLILQIYGTPRSRN